MNMLASGVAGVLIAHFALGASLSPELVMNAMLAPLGAMVVAGFMKHF